MFVYIEYPNKTTKNLLEIINISILIQIIWLQDINHIQKSILFLYTNNEQMGKK